MVIALFRHGLTKENEKKAYIGWQDSPLSEKGIKQLKEKSFCPNMYEQLFSSDLLRAKQSADFLFPFQEKTESFFFRELNFGDWEGKTYHQLKENGWYRKWMDDPFTIAPPNGESFPDFAERVEKGWQMLMDASHDSQKLAVVTHGGVIRYLLHRYSKEEKGFFDYNVAIESGFELMWEDINCFRRRERCTLLQEAALTEKRNGH
jgi:alpha-ribazole phosphatase